MRYIAWHYSKGLKKFLEIWNSFISFVWHFFSIGILLRTLFFPWKRDISFVGGRGFHPLLFLRRSVENFFSRLMGMLVRLTTIVLGLALEIGVLILGFASLILWIFLPAALIFSAAAFYGLFVVAKNSVLYEIFVGDLLFFSIWLAVVSAYSFYLFTKGNWREKTLDDLSQAAWFKRVWNRMGFETPDRETIRAFSEGATLQSRLNALGLSLESFGEIIEWEGKRHEEEENRFDFWNRDNLLSIDSIGKSWAYAYTVELDKFSRELPKKLAGSYKNSYLMGHTKDIEMAELVLSRPYQNSILFVGEPGVGKKTLIDLIAKKIHEERTSPALKSKRLVELDLGSLIAQTDEKFLAARLHRIFQEAAFSGNVILVIHDLHEFLSPRKTDISSILAQYLGYPAFQVLATCTTQAFHEYVEKNAAVMKLMDKIIISEPSPKETKFAMLYALEESEKDRAFFTYQAIEEIVALSSQYVTDAPLPEKAIDMLEEVLIFWAQRSAERFVSKADVEAVFSAKTKIPLGQISESEKDKLMDLEAILHQRVVGQDEAVRQIAEAVRRSRAGIADESKPKGSFLFLGPTGVGKTETAKALAEAYFGSEDRMIRLDMSEFQAADSIDRLIGSEKTGQPGQLITKVNENPFSVLLLDEIEKAYPDILNLFLQVLDEGWLTDAFGKKTLFKNNIIIATSNAGSDIIKEEIEKGKPSEEIYSEIISHVTHEGVFRTEFLNRFEKVIFFRSLEGEELREVVSLILKHVADKIYVRKNIRLEFDPDLVGRVIEKGYDSIFGARSIKHFVEDRIEDMLAKKIIAQEIVPGGSIRLSASDIG